MAKIKIDKASVKDFDCIYCEEADIPVPKELNFIEEKIYQIECPVCGEINYIIPNVLIEPIPFTKEDIQNMTKKNIKDVVYMNPA